MSSISHGPSLVDLTVRRGMHKKNYPGFTPFHF